MTSYRNIASKFLLNIRFYNDIHIRAEIFLYLLHAVFFESIEQLSQSKCEHATNFFYIVFRHNASLCVSKSPFCRREERKTTKTFSLGFSFDLGWLRVVTCLRIVFNVWLHRRSKQKWKWKHWTSDSVVAPHIRNIPR